MKTTLYFIAGTAKKTLNKPTRCCLNNDTQVTKMAHCYGQKRVATIRISLLLNGAAVERLATTPRIVS